MVMPHSEWKISDCGRRLRGQIDSGLFIAEGLVSHPCVSGDQLKNQVWWPGERSWVKHEFHKQLP